jgi:diguanylate cyclase (GGDEF)-like protein
MTATHDLRLVLLSIAISVVASYTALDLAGRVTAAQGRIRQVWLVGGAIAMGTGIWAMHFIAMLAYNLPIAINFDYLIVFLSMVVAIIASGIALFIASRQQFNKFQFLIGGGIMGSAIAAMHYVGMAAMEINAKIEYDLIRVALSVAIAIGASLVALWLAFQLRSEATGAKFWLKKIGSSLIMGIAIAGMHYTAMTAVCIGHSKQLPVIVSTSHSKQTELAIAVGLATLAILALTLQATFIDRRLNIETQLIYLANHDSLTGLCNRRHFQELLEYHLSEAKRQDLCGALLFIDLDNFKDVNDTLGHQAGDELLRQMTVLLQRQLRQTDVLARLGGDEFAVLLPQITENDVQELTQRLLESFEASNFVLNGASVRMTASIGVTLFPIQEMTVDELLARADRAMYQSKESGRNSFRLSNDDDRWRNEAESRNIWKNRLIKAISEEAFVLYYQPILDLRSNEISRYEVLLRLVGEEGEIIAPSSFLAIAESSGFISKIDRWVVRQAIQLLAQLTRTGQEVFLEVNLSGKSLSDHELLPIIQNELALTGVNPASLVLEITETAAIEDSLQTQKFIYTLQQVGCQFALDDFGVGYSSFAQLKHLPVNYLKIDGSFIKKLSQDPIDRSLVKAIVEVSQALGKSTIAEFVEDQETVQWLRQLGIDYAQGYYIGRPKAVTELLADCAHSVLTVM